MRASHLSSERQNIGRKRQEEERQNVRKTLPVGGERGTAVFPSPAHFVKPNDTLNKEDKETRDTVSKLSRANKSTLTSFYSLRIASEASSHLEVGPRDGSVGAPRRGVSRPISQNRSGTRGPTLKPKLIAPFGFASRPEPFWQSPPSGRKKI